MTGQGAGAARFPPVNNVLGNYSGRILRQACGYTPATMVRASRAVWRYRWEIAPFLLAGAAQAVPYWFIALLHNFGLLSSARWATGRSGWQAAYPGDAVWFLSGIVGFALLFVVLRHGIRRLEALGRPVTKALWEALLLALGVWLLAYAAWHALTVFLGLGVWWNVYPWFYYLVLLSIVGIVGWAVRTLWSRGAATALFIVIAAIIVAGSAAPRMYTVRLEAEVLWLGAWLTIWAIFAAQLLLLLLTGVLAHHLPSQPAWRQWLMTGGLLTTASAVMVATLVLLEALGSTSLPFWFGYVWDLLESGDTPLRVPPVGVVVATNLAHVYAVAALAFVASFGFHTLLLRRHPAAAKADPPPAPPSEER